MCGVNQSIEFSLKIQSCLLLLIKVKIYISKALLFSWQLIERKREREFMSKQREKERKVKTQRTKAILTKRRLFSKQLSMEKKNQRVNESVCARWMCVCVELWTNALAHAHCRLVFNVQLGSASEQKRWFELTCAFHLLLEQSFQITATFCTSQLLLETCNKFSPPPTSSTATKTL